MLPLLLMEPTAASKQRASAAPLVGQGRRASLDAVALKRRLRELRDHCLAHYAPLADQLASRLAATPGVKLTLAQEAQDAVRAIGESAAGNGLIAVNKSAVVSKELAPGLRQAGFQVLETYYDALGATNGGFRDYWQLPPLSSQGVLESYLRPASGLEKRRQAIRRQGVRDFIGLLGVNAAAAQDGTLLFLQHFGNIGQIVEQAKKLILVVALDKIVPTAADAAFQTQCMAIFGWEAILLDLHPNGKAALSLDALPFISPASEEGVEAIVLDNGRRRIAQGDYRELFACIGCRACLKGCPTYPFFGGPQRWCPKEYAYFFALGQNPAVELCVGCGLCRAECPVDIDIPHLMLLAKSEALARQGTSLPMRLLGNFEGLARLGGRAPFLVNPVLGSPALRRLAEGPLGIKAERQPPKFQGQTFAKWFQSRRGASGG